MISFMKEMNIPFIIVMTKADKLKKKEFQRRLEESKTEFESLDDCVVIPFSSQSGLGLEELKQLIQKAIN